MSLTSEEVLTWSAEWIYIPEESRTVDRPGWLLAAHPTTWSDPTVVVRIDSDEEPGALVDAAMAAAADLDRHEVVFWVHDAVRPAGLEAELRDRGARLHEELAVLARTVDGPVDLDVPPDVEIRASLDLETERDFDRIGWTVFGGAPLDDEQLQRDLDRHDPDTGLPYVAYLDGRAVGAAGVSYHGEVARMWGGSVVEEARGRGVYRALLAHRLEAAREHGSRAALVKGRLTTSAPTLRRAGFEQYGEERGWLLGGA